MNLVYICVCLNCSDGGKPTRATNDTQRWNTIASCRAKAHDSVLFLYCLPPFPPLPSLELNEPLRSDLVQDPETTLTASDLITSLLDPTNKQKKRKRPKY